MTDILPTAWIPTALLQHGDLTGFPAGTLVVEAAALEGGAVTLFLRVTLGEEPGLLQLSPAPDAPTGCIFGIDADEVGFGLLPETPIELEWDLEGGTSPPGLTFEAVGQLGFSNGGARLVVIRRKARGASYLDPSDWTLRDFKGGQDARILASGWRLVLPLAPDRRVVVFDATPDQG